MKNFFYKLCLFQILFLSVFIVNAQTVQLNSPSSLQAGVTVGGVALTITNNTASPITAPVNGTFPYTLSIPGGASGLNFITSPAFTSSDPNTQVTFASFT